MKICENCKKEHKGIYGSGRFCSKKCARGFSTKAKRSLINERVSKTLTGTGRKAFKKACLNCKKDFKTKKEKRKFCSVSCSNKYQWKNKDYRKKMSKMSSDLAKKRHLNNDETFGWQTRKNLEPSYPESIGIRCLNELKIDYEREYPFGKYFIDFALKNKIAIEIDGKQHELEDRIKSDKKKDKLLKSKGWKIFRIKYPKENIKDNIKEIVQNYGE